MANLVPPVVHWLECFSLQRINLPMGHIEDNLRRVSGLLSFRIWWVCTVFTQVTFLSAAKADRRGTVVG